MAHDGEGQKPRPENRDHTRSHPDSGTADSRPESVPFWERAQQTFQTHRLGALVIGVTAVLGLLGAGAGLFFMFFPDLQPKPKSDSALAIENVAVGRVEEIHGRIEVPDSEPVKKVFEAPVLDILLSNKGEETAYVKSGEFTFFAARDMAQCSNIGSGDIDYVQFQVNVPVTVKPGDRTRRTTFFRVRPRTSESLAFSLGPAGDTVSEYWLYGFSLELTTGSTTISVPKAAVSNVDLWEHDVLQSAAKLTSPSWPQAEESRKCYMKSLKVVNQIIDEATYFPAGLQEFAVKLEAIISK